MSGGRRTAEPQAVTRAIQQLALGQREEAAASLARVVRELAEEPALAAVYARLSSSLRSLLEGERAASGALRLPCPACGVAFLDGVTTAHRRLTLLEACSHCDAELPELQRHVDGRTYPPDARVVSASARLEQLERELEHVRHLAGLAHPTTVRWERTVAEAALVRGRIERARGLLARAARASLTPDVGYAHLLRAIHDAERPA